MFLTLLARVQRTLGNPSLICEAGGSGAAPGLMNGVIIETERATDIFASQKLCCATELFVPPRRLKELNMSCVPFHFTVLKQRLPRWEGRAD